MISISATTSRLSLFVVLRNSAWGNTPLAANLLRRNSPAPEQRISTIQ
jgi:hypothetical protein